jgi:hypothetical protein
MISIPSASLSIYDILNVIGLSGRLWKTTNRAIFKHMAIHINRFESFANASR